MVEPFDMGTVVRFEERAEQLLNDFAQEKMQVNEGITVLAIALGKLYRECDASPNLDQIRMLADVVSWYAGKEEE